MRIVSEQEINRAITISDVLIGVSCASLTGLVMALWLYFCLGIGVG